MTARAEGNSDRPNPRPGAGRRCNARADDDDFDRAAPNGNDTEEFPTTAGMIGFMVSLVSLGLLVIVAILWILKDQEDRQLENLQRTRWILYWFMFLDVASFLAGMTAMILGIRGLSPSNPLYRGYSLTALILGILEMVTTAIFGMFLFCCTLFFEMLRGGGG